VLARRQIEMYSRLIHTVDHVEGTLRDEFDGLDAFLSHAWAVTVTGAPKAWAMQFIERHERSPRRWYGGAVGVLGFDGTINTGLTLRTLHLQDGVAHLRVGATLLHDSDPEEEEAETLLKASAFLDALRRPRSTPDAGDPATGSERGPGVGRKVLLVDAQDSFVHTLADYFRQNGAEVTTLRVGFPLQELDRVDPDLVVLSPGPGRPEDFPLAELIDATLERGLPLFGVCLGLQALTEYFGGKLGQLPLPVHGKSSAVRVLGGELMRGFPEEFEAGRYHSLFARRDSLPDELQVTAESDDGVVMAIEHTQLPISAVQFHPESILTMGEGLGLALIANVLASVGEKGARA
jgi:anthranilate synthase